MEIIREVMSDQIYNSLDNLSLLQSNPTIIDRGPSTQERMVVGLSTQETGTERLLTPSWLKILVEMVSQVYHCKVKAVLPGCVHFQLKDSTNQH